MNLVQYDPKWFGLKRIQDEVNSLFHSIDPDNPNALATVNWAPAVDIKEEDKRYVVIADIPGVAPKDIEITCESNALIIRGERESEKKEEKEGYRRVERSCGSFYRRFVIPDNGDLDQIKAKSKDGVLEITIPKSGKSKSSSKRIKVDS